LQLLAAIASLPDVLQLRFLTSCFVLLAAVSSTGCLKSGGGGSDDCDQGSEGCECYPNDTCDDDLECYSNLCVDPEDAPSGGKKKPSSTKGDGGSDETDDTGPSSKPSDDEPSTDDPSDPVDDDPSPPADDDPVTPDDPGPSGPDPSGTSPDPQGPGPNTPSDPGGEPPSGSPVARNGALSVIGTRIVNEHGEPVQLKGVSSMWLNWEDDGYAEDLQGLEYMRDNWNLSVIRAAMGIDPEGAYLDDPDKARGQVERIVQNAIAAGVYVIIDWHDHEAISHRQDAEAFFSDMAAKYGGTPNVLYETFNEPLDLSWSSTLKPYHESVTSVIRARDPDNIVILGTPNWDQDADVAAGDPLAASNVMYAVHFYSCDHGASLRSKAQQALSAGLPLFVSEWGAASADGLDTDSSCIAEAAAWHDWMDANGISWAAWKFDNCVDATCFFVDAAVPTSGNWTSDQLNGLHPNFAIERMKTPGPTGPAPVDPGPTPVDPGPVTPACTPSGSCASGDGMDCMDGELVARDCSACSLLECGVACCESVGYFGAISQPTFTINDNIIAGFSASSTGVTLTMDFDFASYSGDEQVGAVTFALDGLEPVDPNTLEVCLTTTDNNNVQVSLEDGDSGCLYWMTVGGGCAAWDSSDTGEPVACWGDFELSGQGYTKQINVRIVSQSSGAEQLRVESIRW